MEEKQSGGRRWATRFLDRVEVWPEGVKPLEHDGFFYGPERESPARICIGEFKKLFGFFPKDRELLEVEFTARIL